jgi:hypothetical protein
MSADRGTRRSQIAAELQICGQRFAEKGEFEEFEASQTEEESEKEIENDREMPGAGNQAEFEN